jgi:hypothetical protein
MGLRYVWTPSGDEIALTESIGTAGFSPDSTRIALQHRAPGQPIQIVDATTGAVQQTVTLPSGLFVGWADNEHLMVREHGETLRVVTLTGTVTREVALVAWAAELHVGLSDGLTPAAAGLTFGAR